MATYKIDAAHSEITFKVRHLVISTVSGSFLKFDATMTSEKEDFTDASIAFEADVDSVTTNNEQRDGHLKNDDFFNAEKYPKIYFKSSSFEKKSDDEYVLNGDITLRDITKPISLNVMYNGDAVFYGQSKLGFEITGKINRKEFGLKWHAVTETGGIALSDEVRLALNIQMVKQA